MMGGGRQYAGGRTRVLHMYPAASHATLNGPRSTFIAGNLPLSVSAHPPAGLPVRLPGVDQKEIPEFTPAPDLRKFRSLHTAPHILYSAALPRYKFCPYQLEAEWDCL